MYYFAKSPVIFIIFTVAYCVFVVMTIVSAIIFIYCVSETFFATSASATEMTYREAFKFCADDQKSLPVPNDAAHERKIIAQMRKSSAYSCDYVFFGWQTDMRNRYKSVDGYRHRYETISLKEDVVIPNDESMWYELKVEGSKVSVVNTYNSSAEMDGTGRNIYFLHSLKSECVKNKFRCAFAKKSAKSNLVAEFNVTRTNNEKLYGVVPIDIDVIPTDFSDSDELETSGFALAVKYTLNYQFGDVYINYHPTRYTVVDPEYSCMAYDTKKGRVVTHPCEGPACPYCIV